MNKSTIVTLIVLAISWINMALLAFGFEELPWSGETIGEVFSSAFSVVMTGIAYWKNQSWTKPAVEADKVLELIKQGLITQKDIDKLIGGKK